MILERLKERERVFASMRVSAEADARIRAAIQNHAPRSRTRRLTVAWVSVASVVLTVGVVLAKSISNERRNPAVAQIEEGARDCQRETETEIEPALAPMSAMDTSGDEIPILRAAPRNLSKLSPRVRQTTQPATLPTPTDPDEAVETIARLRAERRFEEAVRFIEARVEIEHDPRAVELFMFELATLLEHPIGDHTRACAVWRAYLRRFVAGRYASHAENALNVLTCEREGNSQEAER